MCVLPCLLDQAFALLFELLALVLDDDGEELVLEAFERYRVVDDHRLAKVAGRELRIGQLGVEVHAKVGIEVDLLVAEYDELTSFGT